MKNATQYFFFIWISNIVTEGQSEGQFYLKGQCDMLGLC